MKYEDLDNLAEQLDKEAEEALKALKHHPPQDKSDYYSRFGGMNVDVKNVALGSVSLDILNEWLKDMSIGAEVVEIEAEKSKLMDARDKAWNLANEEIGKLDAKIKEVRKNRKIDNNSERISKIISQAIDQDPGQIATNAKNLIVSDRSELMVDVNKIDELTDSEKEALYRQYIREAQILAGIISPEA